MQPRNTPYRLLLPLSLLLFIVCAVAAQAAPPPSPRPVIVLCDGLSVDSLTRADMPNLREVARTGRVALLNTATAGPQDNISSVLTIALGMLAPSEPGDCDIYRKDERVNDAYAGVEFTRRTGLALPNDDNATVHLGIASLQRRGLSETLLSAHLEKADYHHALLPAGGHRAGLLCVNASGLGGQACPFVDPLAIASWASQTGAGAVIDLGADRMALNAFLGEFIRTSTRLLILSPMPQVDANGRPVNRMSVAIYWDGITNAGLLTSATTRTPGLIANIDVAPTILSWFGIRAPSYMTGHPIANADSHDPVATLKHMDRSVTTNARALVPEFVTLGIIVSIIVFAGILITPRLPKTGNAFAFGVLVMGNMPLAMLLVAPLACPTAKEQTACTLVIMALGAIIEHILGRSRTINRSPVMLLMMFTAIVILIDGLTGQSMIKCSLLSGYQLRGIRFYGIGNEYMGVLLGCVLHWAFIGRLRPVTAACLFAVTTFVLCTPMFGAKAGGAVTALVAFGMAWMVLRGLKPRWTAAVGWCLAGFGVAFGIAALDRATPGGATTHMGGALAGAQASGAGYLGQIVARKALMNAHIFVTPGAVGAYIGFIILYVLIRFTMWKRIEALVVLNPEWTRALPVVGYGMLAGFVFNDSGTVATIFMAAVFAIHGIHALFSQAELLNNAMNQV